MASVRFCGYYSQGNRLGGRRVHKSADSIHRRFEEMK